MSDKNFKVKNGLDANGAVTITQPSTSTVPLTILSNTLATGSNLLEVKRPDGTVRFAVGNDGALIVNSNISFNGGSMSMYPGNSGQTALSVFGQTNQSVANLIVKAATGQSGNVQEWRDQNNNVAARIGPDFAFRSIAGGFFGTATGNIVGSNYLGVRGWAESHIPFVVQGVASQTGDLTRWVDSSANTLAKVDASGSITAVDLTLSGNLTVNGTTTNLNSTNLIIEDKNIIIADVATPTDTTADGAGITIKGATDKTLNWVQSTGSFTSSDPFIINTTSTTRSNLIVKAIASQTSNLTEWQNSLGDVVAKVDSNAIFNSLNSGSGADSYSSIIIGGRWIRNEQRANLTRFGVNTGEWHLASNPDNSAIAITDSQVGVFATSTTLPLLTVKGMASQTANLQEWQNASGTVLSSINASGNLILGNQYISHTGASGYGRLQLLDGGTNQTTLYPASAGLLIGNAGVTGMSVVKVRGTSDQTGNLTEWQNSAGAVLAKVTATGMLDITPVSGDTINFRNASGGLTLWGGNTRYYMNTELQMTGGSWVAGRLAVDTSGTANVGIVVRGQASQSANLQQWQNSAGGVLAYVSNDGTFQNTGDINSGSTIRLGSGASSAGGYPVFAIKNATVAPTSNPTDGGVIYVESGSLKYRGQGGAITTIASSSLDDQEDIENSEVQLIQYGAEGSVLQNLPTRIHPAEQLLKESVLWLDPAHSSAGLQTIQNLGWGGTALNATAGENTSVSTDEPKYLSWEGENYIYATGEVGNFMISSASTSLGMTTSSDLDMRVKVSLDALSGINQMLISTWWYRLHLTSSGHVSLSWHDNTAFNNINSSNLLSSIATVGQEIWIRGTLKLNNGSGVSEVKFYTSINGTTWTQLGTTYNGASTSILGAGGRSLSLEVGSLDGGVASVVSGKIYRAQVLQGVDGVVVFDCDTSLVSSGSATTFNALTGHIMTITRSTVGRKMVAVTHPLWLFGTNDFLKIAHNNLLNFATNQPFTIFLSSREFASTAGTTILLAKGGYGVWQGYTITSTNNSTQVYFAGPQANTSYYYSANLGKSTTSRNYFYGRSTTNTFSYVNNNLIGGSEEVAPQYDTSNNYDFYLGRQTTGQNSNMEVFGVAIWRRALTSAEIATVSRYYEGRAI